MTVGGHMTIDRKRLLGLALESLLNERSRIDAEIQAVTAELKGAAKSAPAKAPKKPAKRRPKLSAAERKTRSDRMKKYWADRKKKQRQTAKKK